MRKRSLLSWAAGAAALAVAGALLWAGLGAARSASPVPAAYPGPETGPSEPPPAYPPPQGPSPTVLLPSQAPPTVEATSRPPATHDPSLPTLIPPNLTLEAEAAAIPPCCPPDDENASPVPPAQTQHAFMTAWAMTPRYPTLPPGVPSATPVPVGEYLAPSGEWVIQNYADSNVSYSFEYPSNWFTELDKNQTYVHNLSPGTAPKNQLDPNRIKIIVSPLAESRESYPSLEAYLDAPDRVVPTNELILQSSPVTLASGYQSIRQERTAFMSNGGIIVIYITNGETVYSLTVFSRNSLYTDVVEHIANTLRIH